MELYLIRHADAIPLGEGGIMDDADRHLTDKGEDQAKRLASGLQKRGILLNLVLTSPILRAKQTADGMLQHWAGGTPEIRECADLAPGFRRKRLVRLLTGLGVESIGLVGHQPDLGEFAGWLIGSRNAQIDMAKAGVAYIHCDEAPRKGGGTLHFLVGPEWLEK